GRRRLAELGVLRRAGSGSMDVATVASWNGRDAVRYDAAGWAALGARLVVGTLVALAVASLPPRGRRAQDRIQRLRPPRPAGARAAPDPAELAEHLAA